MSPVKSPEQHSVRDVGKKNKFVVGNDETDELPPGWTKEVKTRKIGSKTKVDRRYTDPVTGYIFHSLKDVQRYLKTGEVGRLATKPKNNGCVDPDNKNERLHIVVENDEADELPPGWTKELKTRKTGSKIKVDRHYTDPVTGYIFRSLKDAQRYVKTGEVGRLVTKPKNVDTDNEDERLHVSIVAENDEADELPPGWTMELKTRKSGSRTKFDRRYTDPVTGYIFRSLKDAQLYVKTGVLGRLACKPKNNEDENLHIEERSESKDGETLRRKTQQAKHLSSIVDNASPASLPPAKTRRATRQAGIEINAPPPSLPDTRTGRKATRARLVNLASQKKRDKKTEAEKMTDKHNQENHGNPKET
ncbi:putative Methyl-CpG-binding domain-containing protein [Helianthus debilis subsp. tardiflorus]